MADSVLTEVVQGDHLHYTLVSSQRQGREMAKIPAMA